MQLPREAILGVAALAVGSLALWPWVSATPSGPTSTALTTRLVDQAHVGTAQPLDAWLETTDGVAVSGATLRFQRRLDGAWRYIGSVSTDTSGHAALEVAIRAQDNRFRVVWKPPVGSAYDGATSGVEVVSATKAPAQATLTGPGSVVDEKKVTLRIRWHTVDDRAITGRVGLYVRAKDSQIWSLARRPQVGAGMATVAVRPRLDTVWQVRAPSGRWWTSTKSAVHRIDNLPPVAPVVMPPAAPLPRIELPVQPRAVGTGANAVVSTIPSGVWQRMVGRSWHTGCPVGRSGLRLIRINYWGYDGYRHRGELVVASRVAHSTAGTFASLYRQQLPIRAMYRVDRFGWSDRLQGANDYRSMAAGNTSAFNCRYVVGNAGVLSLHSYGTAIDINTWENPYRSDQETPPNAWWDSRTKPYRIVYRSSSHPVVQAFAENGFRWLGSSDWHHFQLAEAGSR